MKFKDIKEYIKSDLYRYTGKISFKLMLRNYFLNRGFKYTFWLRLCKSDVRLVRFIAKVMHFRLSQKYLIQIPRNIQVGYGLYLGHHMCVVVNGTAVLGNNINLSQFTTIGANDGGKAAVIGDNVYIGPSCCLVGNVYVRENSTIGAGSVVVKNVEENTTVAGTPAKYISDKKPGRFVNRRWELD